jgi:hypothetical protein
VCCNSELNGITVIIAFVHQQTHLYYMRTQLLALALLGLFFNSAFATIRTVSNAPSSTLAQFNTINAAIAASADGDTVLINGSSVNYASFTLSNKRLTIIGPGWAPDKVNSLPAVVLGANITGSGCSGSEIHGLYFSGTAVTINNNKPDSLKFIRNRFSNAPVLINAASVNYKDYIFEGNYFDLTFCCDVAIIAASTASSYQNFLFQNNVFFASNSNAIGGSGAHISSFSNGFNTVLFDHNVFYGPQSGLNTEAFSSCGFMLLTNNIFIRRNVSVNNSVLSNNLTFNLSNNTPWTVNNNSDGGGNISNTDPQMASQANITAGNQNSPLFDYSIAAGPANNAGSDGKDIGVLFDSVGSLNWANSRNSRLPRIYNMTITNPVNTAGGTLHVTVEGRKSK